MRAGGLWWFFLAVLALCFGAGAFARAEAPVSVSASMLPGDFLAPGEATLTVEIVNGGAAAMENLRISPSETQPGEAVESVPSGETMHYAYAVTVTQKMLDAGHVDVFVTCQMDGKPFKAQASAPVKRVSHLPRVAFARRVARGDARAGDAVEITYFVENTGEVALQDARVVDALGAFVSEGFALAPGESKIVRSYAVIAQTAFSAARLLYASAESGTAYAQYTPEAEIRAREDDVRLNAQAEACASGERARILVRAENAGALKYRVLSLSEPTLGEILQVPHELRAGETFSVEVFTPPLSKSQEYAFALRLRDEGGTEALVFAGAAHVRVTPAEGAQMALSAEPSAETPANAGEAAFTLRLTGAGEDARNVTLGEKTLGALRTLAVLRAGRETALTVSVPAEEGARLRFYAEYNAGGAAQTLLAEPVLVPSGAVRRAARADSGQAALYALVRARALPVVVGAACGALALGFAAFAGARVYRRRKRKNALEKTGKFTPARAREDKTGRADG